VIRSWKEIRPLLERWRRAATTLHIKLRRPRAIDIAPIDFVRGEVMSAAKPENAAPGKLSEKFTGRLIFATHDDLTIRRPSGAILVIDNYEIASLSDGHTHFEPARH
jgi:hypothetical protein